MAALEVIGGIVFAGIALAQPGARAFLGGSYSELSAASLRVFLLFLGTCVLFGLLVLLQLLNDGQRPERGWLGPLLGLTMAYLSAAEVCYFGWKDGLWIACVREGYPRAVPALVFSGGIAMGLAAMASAWLGPLAFYGCIAYGLVAAVIQIVAFQIHEDRLKQSGRRKRLPPSGA